MTGMGSNNQLGRRSDVYAHLPFEVSFARGEGEPPVTSVSLVAFGGQHTIMLVH